MDNPGARHSHDHLYPEDHHTTGLHSGTELGEDQHEKKSVLKKVKDKAKKIKKTIAKHGHGHHDEHGQEFDEEDDENEDMGEDTAFKGGPICESTVIKSRTIPAEELYAGQSHGPTLERTTAMKEDTVDPKDREDALFPRQDLGKEDKSKQYGDNKGRPTAMEDHPYGLDNTDSQTKEGLPESSGVSLGESMGLEKDPHAPKDRGEAFDPPNYQSKVADPTGAGGEEVGITPIISALNKMTMQDRPAQRFSTGTVRHDQFSPEPLSGEANVEKPSYQKNDKGEEIQRGGGDQKPASSVTEYGKKFANTVTETLSPVYGKVVEAGSVVMSKVHGRGGNGSEPEGVGGAPDKGVSMKAYLAEKLKPGDEDRALSEIISDALHKRKEEPEQEHKLEATGKVTESEEVARRLSTEKKPAADSGDVKFDSSSNVSSGSGMVDRLRGAVSSWFGRGGDSQNQTSSEPIGSGNGGEGRGNEVAGKKA